MPKLVYLTPIGVALIVIGALSIADSTDDTANVLWLAVFLGALSLLPLTALLVKRPSTEVATADENSSVW